MSVLHAIFSEVLCMTAGGIAGLITAAFLVGVACTWLVMHEFNT